MVQIPIGDDIFFYLVGCQRINKQHNVKGSTCIDLVKKRFKAKRGFGWFEVFKQCTRLAPVGRKKIM